MRADGANLYPAMPYTAYAALNDADVHALYAYFMKGVAPVDTPTRETALPFPMNIRASMKVWNALFLKDQPLAPPRSVLRNGCADATWPKARRIAAAVIHRAAS